MGVTRGPVTRKDPGDLQTTADRYALLQQRMAQKRCKRWRHGWCNRPESHGIDIHGTAEETKAVLCCSAREGSGARKCTFTAETCPYASHVSGNEMQE